MVENMPGPIGGMFAIQEKIKYPEIAKRAGIQGKVIIQAFIDENGNVVHAKVLNGIGGGCDEMAVDAVKKTKFNPGTQNGKPVKVQVTIPIVFKLTININQKRRLYEKFNLFTFIFLSLLRSKRICSRRKT